MLALSISFSASAFAQISRSPWQMHKGQDVIKLEQQLPSNGALPENGYIAFERASIPDEGDGWEPAPNPETINFGGPTASNFDRAGATCRHAVDYTYFQTFVDVPAGARVDEFKIAFKGMDDASRITIFNAAHPGGQIVPGSYVTRASGNIEAATTDLKALVSPGKNRVVVTQVDWCPQGNQLQSAQVRLNGSTINTLGATALGPFLPTSHGDVHIRSTDGLRYDFQAAGDYLLLQSTDAEVIVQARQEMWDQNPNVSVNRAGAMRVMNDTVELYMLPEVSLYINGRPTPIPASRLDLPAGGNIQSSGTASKKTLMIYWPNESMTGRFVYYANKTMDVEVRRVLSSPRTFEGMIGNMDGNRDNDMQIRGGANLGASLTSDTIARVGESWRVRADESLFTRAHPAPEGRAVQQQPGIADLDPSARRDASQICKDAGVKDAMALRNCVYDVAATGDKTFVESARQLQETVAALPASERAGEMIEPAQALSPPAASGTTGGDGLVRPGAALTRGSRYPMAGHYLTFQDDGNLCVYASAGNRWVWCINNDPNVPYQRSAKVELTREGQLRVTDADGGIVWQVPPGNPQPGTVIHLTDDGVLQLRAATGAVVWSSR